MSSTTTPTKVEETKKATEQKVVASTATKEAEKDKKEKEKEKEKEVDPGWRAMESNPEVITNLCHDLGLPSKYSFVDVFGLDEDMLAMLPPAVHALIFLFADYKKDFSLSKEWENAVEPLAKEAPFFLEQISSLGNACGTIAAIHSVLNTLSIQKEMEEKGILSTYYKRVQTMTPTQRGEALAKDEKIKEKHNAYVEEGQTEAQSSDQEEVAYHFISFIPHNQTVFELDGLNTSPIKHNLSAVTATATSSSSSSTTMTSTSTSSSTSSSTASASASVSSTSITTTATTTTTKDVENESKKSFDFLRSAIQVIKRKYIDSSNGSIRFSMMALVS
eukprot:TRINITY_DN583_c1_g1_i1.p1 TRINITY_DN583_c1_g1~~TRINITY_DN583_c1_g1_i1.p1  ORF type:complete len:342 (+),score=138.99 TRINITY_DN583_c1_g1_i1:29-1027(+)